jgi:hypothetical protein
VACFIRTVTVPGEPVQVLEAKVRSLTDALNQLTAASIQNLLETGGPTNLSMEILRTGQHVRWYLNELTETLANTKAAWNLM